MIGVLIFLNGLFFLCLFDPAVWAVGTTVGANAVASWTNPVMTAAAGVSQANLAGISVWVGTESQVYTIHYNAGLVSSFPISVLKLFDGQYYMAVQAYDTN